MIVTPTALVSAPAGMATVAPSAVTEPPLASTSTVWLVPVAALPSSPHPGASQRGAAHKAAVASLASREHRTGDSGPREKIALSNVIGHLWVAALAESAVDGHLRVAHRDHSSSRPTPPQPRAGRSARGSRPVVDRARRARDQARFIPSLRGTCRVRRARADAGAPGARLSAAVPTPRGAGSYWRMSRAGSGAPRDPVEPVTSACGSEALPSRGRDMWRPGARACRRAPQAQVVWG